MVAYGNMPFSAKIAPTEARNVLNSLLFSVEQLVAEVAYEMGTRQSESESGEFGVDPLFPRDRGLT